MTLRMQRKMIGASEGTATRFALERLVARVFAHVPCELIRASETPVAAGKCARVRLLASVDALMCLEVRALRVRLQSVSWQSAQIERRWSRR